MNASMEKMWRTTIFCVSYDVLTKFTIFCGELSHFHAVITGRFDRLRHRLQGLAVVK
tara:strand:- start:971 stop:1141 length:171 start_codon:yes stop_codon:yes gene_type:complete